MKTIDIILLSYAFDKKHWLLTKQAIDTCHASEKNIIFNILVIESFKEAEAYNGATTIYVEGEFNYNKYMNLGISKCENEWICMCNNDLIFKQGWATILIKEMENHKALSGSPMSDQAILQKPYKNSRQVMEGLRGSLHISGWCIMVSKKIFNIIGKINESRKFWCSETLYALQLKENNIKHIFVPHSKVYHVCSQTLNDMPKDVYNDYTHLEIKRFGGSAEYTKCQQQFL